MYSFLKNLSSQKILLLSIFFLYVWRNYFSLQSLPNLLMTDDILPLQAVINIKNNVFLIYLVWLCCSVYCIVKEINIWLISMIFCCFMLMCTVYNSTGHVFHNDLIPIFALTSLLLRYMFKTDKEILYFSILVSNMYLMSGVSKIVNGLHEWISGSSLQFALLYNQISRSSNLSLIHDYSINAFSSVFNYFHILSIIILIVELTAPLILFYNRKIFSIVFLLFHFLNYLLFGLKFTEYYLIFIFLNIEYIVDLKNKLISKIFDQWSNRWSW